MTRFAEGGMWWNMTRFVLNHIMNHNIGTVENRAPRQYDNLQSYEYGYNVQRFSSPSPTLESPDALHFHREFPDFWGSDGEYMRLIYLIP